MADTEPWKARSTQGAFPAACDNRSWCRTRSRTPGTSAAIVKLIAPSELLSGVGLVPQGPVRWGDSTGAQCPGVYVVEWPRSLAVAPVCLAAVQRWIDDVQGMQVSGTRPTAAQLAAEVAAWWVPRQTVVYLGQTMRPVEQRVQEFYRTTLGARRPHAGGMWLKALESLEESSIWWAGTDDPKRVEAELMSAFALACDPRAIPFANLKVERPVPGIAWTRKPHRVRRQRR